MKKFTLAFLALVGLFVASIGTQSSAAPSAPDESQFGACRYYCGSKSFATKAQCTAACPINDCEQIC